MQSSLPSPVTSLIGRAEDIAAIGGAVAENRLVTLTGAGGSGKTRLAQHVAVDVAHLAADGAWWVDLQPVDDDLRIPVVIAESAGIEDVPPTRRAPDVLAAGIGSRQMLLVVDNCEHVIDAAATTIDTLLAACPNLRVLATSREALDVPGEHVVRVAPLHVPAVDEPSLEELEAHAATALFLERATTLDRSSLDRAGRRSVAEICRHLDGMPLAIELAAARSRVLSVQQIEAGLDDRFQLLRGARRGRRTDARQRTLDASIAWSFDLLDEDESSMLCRLAVFPSAFDLDGAHAVGSPGDVGRALDLLSALVDKSLVVIRPGVDGRRYRLLESIRHYARNRLEERGATVDARLAHLTFTIAAIRRLTGADGRPGETIGPCVRLPSSLRDDLRAAEDTAIAADRFAELVDLHWPLYVTLVLLGGYREALRPLRVAVEAASELDPLRRARVLSQYVAYLASSNKQAEALALADDAIAAGRAVDDDGLILATTLTSLSFAAAFAGHPGGAEWGREGLTLARRHGTAWGTTATVATAGVWASLGLAYDGHDGEAMEAIDEALAAADAAGLPYLGALAAIFRCAVLHRVECTAAVLEEALADAAARVPEGADRLHVQIGNSTGPWFGVRVGDPDVATRWYEHGLAHAGPVGSSSHAQMGLAAAVVALANGDYDATLEHATAASAVLERAGSGWWRYQAAILILGAHVLRGEPEAAAALERCCDLHASGQWAMARMWQDAFDARLRIETGDPDGALSVLAGMVDRTRRTGAKSLFDIGSLPAAALTATARFEEAATGLGIAARYRRDTGWTDLHTEHTTAAERAAREALGDTRFSEVVGVGEAMTTEQALRWIADLADDAGSRSDRPVSGWDALTPAEVEVARKAAEGLTYQEVGEALFVSPNTVKSHLKSVYSKLDIGTRAELATEVASRDV